MEKPRAAATLVVRVFRDAEGELVGSVQRVRTGERRPFHRAAALGALITEMTADMAGHGDADAGGEAGDGTRHGQPADDEPADGHVRPSAAPGAENSTQEDERR